MSITEIKVDNLTIGITGPNVIPDWIQDQKILTLEYLLYQCMERGFAISYKKDHNAIRCTIPQLYIELIIYTRIAIGYNWSYNVIKTD